jgi:hypothetical protein
VLNRATVSAGAAERRSRCSESLAPLRIVLLRVATNGRNGTERRGGVSRSRASLAKRERSRATARGGRRGLAPGVARLPS